MASPASMETSEPFLRAAISPQSGPYSWKRWLITPMPLVELTRSVSKPIRPRIGTSASTDTWLPTWFMFVICALRPERFSMIAAEVFARNFDEQLFNRLQQVAVGVFFPKHFRARHQNFVAFAAHLLDENGDLHFAASADGEHLRVARLRDAQRDVRADFLHQPVPDVARGDELAVLAGERAVVDGEFHLDGRRINRDVRQRRARLGIANRFADEHVLETR